MACNEVLIRPNKNTPPEKVVFNPPPFSSTGNKQDVKLYQDAQTSYPI